MNKQNSLEDLREVFRRNHVGFPIIMLDGLEVPYLPLENALKELSDLITTHEQQARRDGVESFAKELIKATLNGGDTAVHVRVIREFLTKFLEENPSA